MKNWMRNKEKLKQLTVEQNIGRQDEQNENSHLTNLFTGLLKLILI